MAPTEPTFDERTHAGAVVLYEINQLAATYAILAELVTEDDLGADDPLCQDDVRETVRVACLEAMLVHVRCIIEFLVGRASTRTTRVERDIPPDWFASSWTKLDGPHKLRDWLDLLDAHLSHLSKKRIRPAEGGGRDPIEWTAEMVTQVRDELRRFVEQVDDIGWRLSFDGAVRGLGDVLRRYPDLYTGS